MSCSPYKSYCSQDSDCCPNGRVNQVATFDEYGNMTSGPVTYAMHFPGTAPGKQNNLPALVAYNGSNNAPFVMSVNAVPQPDGPSRTGIPYAIEGRIEVADPDSEYDAVNLRTLEEYISDIPPPLLPDGVAGRFLGYRGTGQPEVLTLGNIIPGTNRQVLSYNAQGAVVSRAINEYPNTPNTAGRPLVTSGGNGNPPVWSQLTANAFRMNGADWFSTQPIDDIIPVFKKPVADPSIDTELGFTRIGSFASKGNSYVIRDSNGRIAVTPKLSYANLVTIPNVNTATLAEVATKVNQLITAMKSTT